MPQKFDSDGVEIAYIDEGEGYPTLLIHGFGSNNRVNWVSTSWVGDLLATGRRVIAFDNRGHGESGKPHEPSAYRMEIMAEDARRLLDHLGIECADVIGYSMGARIAAYLALAHPKRVRSAVFSGLGEEGMVKGISAPEQIAAALRARSLDEITDERARTYRVFADQTKSDREALAACVLGSRQSLTPADVGRISMPVLVAVGSDDNVAGSAEKACGPHPRCRVLRHTGARPYEGGRRQEAQAGGNGVSEAAGLMRCIRLSPWATDVLPLRAVMPYNARLNGRRR